MEPREQNDWLDEALTEVIHDGKVRADFQKWQNNHPEAIKTLTSRADEGQPSDPLWIRRIIMKGPFVKIAAAAIIVLVAAVGVSQFLGANGGTTEPRIVNGPPTIALADGSEVRPTVGAAIRLTETPDRRGFEHIAGMIDVKVAKADTPFVVTTPYGDVRALGTEFTLDLVDSVDDMTKQKVQLLAVKVTEGSVEVANEKGTQVLKAKQQLTVEADAAPYDFTQDERLPDRLKHRISAMVDAFAAGDPAAWAANFNMNYVFNLAKGQVEYDPQRFGGNEADAKRLGEMLKDIKSVEEMSKAFSGAVNISGPTKVYVRSAKINEAGDHVEAECVTLKGPGRCTITSPRWTNFDNDWWQIDD
mgnify:CR=1 FL=1